MWFINVVDCAEDILGALLDGIDMEYIKNSSCQSIRIAKPMWDRIEKAIECVK